MGDKPTIKGFLGLFGLGKKALKPGPSEPVESPEGPKPGLPLLDEVYPGVPVRSEAYHNRKKGRKEHDGSMANLSGILACIERRGVSTPSQIAKELGIPRSTLTYYLKRFIDHPQRIIQDPMYRRDLANRALSHHLAGKRLERLGKGRNVRYRLVADEPKL